MAEATKVAATVEAPKKKRSVEDRLSTLQGRSSLGKDEHLEDLVLYVNCSDTIQVIEDDARARHQLLPAGYTDRAITLVENGVITSREEFNQKENKFLGGTIILTRKRGLKLVAVNILKELTVLDRANPADYE